METLARLFIIDKINFKYKLLACSLRKKVAIFFVVKIGKIIVGNVTGRVEVVNMARLSRKKWLDYVWKGDWVEEMNVSGLL